MAAAAPWSQAAGERCPEVLEPEPCSDPGPGLCPWDGRAQRTPDSQTPAPLISEGPRMGSSWRRVPPSCSPEPSPHIWASRLPLLPRVQRWKLRPRAVKAACPALRDSACLCVASPGPPGPLCPGSSRLGPGGSQGPESGHHSTLMLGRRPSLPEPWTRPRAWAGTAGWAAETARLAPGPCPGLGLLSPRFPP